MMNLTEYRRRSQSLADFLPWAALVEQGVILNKDGSLQRTARFRGPDLDSATAAELVAITSRLNNALRRLGSGWAIFVEAQRLPANHYPTAASPIRRPASSMPSAARNSKRKGPTSRAAITSPSSGCRRPMMPRARRPGSTRAGLAKKRTGAAR